MKKSMTYILPPVLGLLYLSIGGAKASNGDFSSPDYLKLPASQKMDKLWDEITKDSNTGQWHLTSILFESM